jgi:Protein of unknown function (DUF732)
MAALMVLCLLVGGCGGRAAINARAEQRFLNSVYSQAPDISSYRTSSQVVSLAQAVCADLAAGASVQEVGDRVPLVEGDVALPPADLGVVISSAVGVLCPRFDKLLGQ